MQKEQKNYQNFLKGLNISQLNEMQIATLNACEENENIILTAPTGSGKTVAYLLPVIQLIKPEIKNVQVMVVVPSRELALQIDDVIRKMATGYKVTCCYGGHKREIEETNLVQTPTIIVGTPGRICDHIRRNNFTTNDITSLVLDEFDKSLELGFQEEMAFIIKSLPSVNKRILTSATQAVEIPEFVNVTNPAFVNFSTVVDKEEIDEIVLMKLMSPDKDKVETLFKLICQIGNKSMIIFCNHRDAVERVNDFLKDNGLVTVFYHGGMEQQERESAMCKFKNGTSNILVTTDLASRGLDIPNIKYIIHYHLPGSEEIYTHRNGRTARMEAGGKSVIILSEDEVIPAYMKDIADYPFFEKTELPEKPKWSTLFIAAGKKDKINKIDIVGFLSNKANLKKDDIGLIEVKDFYSFAAVRKLMIGNVIEKIKDEKIKNKKVKFAIAK